MCEPSSLRPANSRPLTFEGRKRAEVKYGGNRRAVAALVCVAALWSSGANAAEDWGYRKAPKFVGAGPAAPELPAVDGQAAVTTQKTPAGQARIITVYLRYPGGRLANVTASTGLMLCLHNWGGHAFDGAPLPNPALFDVVIVGVDYYQSGDRDSDPLPYDFGYLQAIDVLRGLQFVYQGLHDRKIPFDHARIYGMGGSGGGNVILMANKFAPRTFACVVDCSGMASLTDDIAFNLPGGSALNARYSRTPASLAGLTQSMAEIRDMGRREHMARMASYGNRCKLVVIHGEDDTFCLAADKKRAVTAMRAAGLDVDPHFISAKDVDGKLVLDSGHRIGDRTALMMHYAGDFMMPQSKKMRRLTGPCDFERHETIVYPVSGGAYTVSYASGFPGISFTEARP